VLDDSELRHRLIAAAAERARDFDLSQIVRRYEALFLEVAAELRGVSA
jgi:glycosyltransferase involved in cell wall biosynthesis